MKRWALRLRRRGGRRRFGLENTVLGTWARSAKRTLEELEVRLHYLATWWDVLAVVKKDRYLPHEQIAEVETFLHEPAKWSAAHGGVSSFPSG